jgi:hypothetical protein
MSDDGGAVFALTNILGVAFMIAAGLVLCWLLFKIVKFVRAVQELQGTASKRPHAHRSAFWNVIDPSALNEQEKIKRSELIAGLGPFLLVFVIFFCVVAALAMVTS